jgi:hypothetical protein
LGALERGQRGAVGLISLVFTPRGSDRNLLRGRQLLLEVVQLGAQTVHLLLQALAPVLGGLGDRGDLGQRAGGGLDRGVGLRQPTFGSRAALACLPGRPQRGDVLLQQPRRRGRGVRWACFG